MEGFSSLLTPHSLLFLFVVARLFLARDRPHVQLEILDAVFPFASNRDGLVGCPIAHVQVVASYEGKRRRDLRVIENSIYGNMKAYTEVDFSGGLDKGSWSIDLFMKNAFDTRGEIAKSIQCLETVCGDPGGVTAIGPKIYTTVTRPRLIGVRVGRKF